MLRKLIVGLTLVLLMYIPYLAPSRLAGQALYAYWTLVALGGLLYAWLKVRGD